jgi:hypothetical protein
MRVHRAAPRSDEDRRWVRRTAGAGCATLLLGTVAFVAGRAAGASSSPRIPSVVVTAAPSTAVQREGGRVVDGVPVGYTDDERGAVAAATAFSRALGGPLLLKPAAFRMAVQAIAAPGEQTTLTRAASQELIDLDHAYHLISLAAAHVPVAVITVPLSFAVTNFTPQTAVVAIWAVGVMAASGHLAATSVWATFQYRLIWASDWRLASVLTLDAGWAPAVVQPTPATSDVPGELGGYERYPDAAAG